MTTTPYVHLLYACVYICMHNNNNNMLLHICVRNCVNLQYAVCSNALHTVCVSGMVGLHSVRVCMCVVWKLIYIHRLY